MGFLVVEHLDHDRQGLGHEQAADDEHDELGLGEHRKAAERHAKGKGARVAHEDVGGKRVEPEKAHAGAGERGGEDGGIEHVGAICDGRHDDHDDHDRACSQAVKAVGEVDGVAHAHEQDVHEQDIEPRHFHSAEVRGEHAQIERVDERDLDRGGDTHHVDGNQAEHRGDDELAHQLGLRGKAQAALLDHFLGVVDKAQAAREDGGNEQRERFRRGMAHHERREDDRDEHDDAAHGGRALLHQVAFRAVGAHLLTDMARFEELDPRRHKHHGDRDGDHDGHEHQKRGV